MFNNKNEATMKKTYMNPTLKVVVLKFKNSLLAGSPGVGNGYTLGNSYSSDDVTYGREFDFDDDEE